MGKLNTDFSSNQRGLAPYEEVMELYSNKADFFREMHNYLQGGVIISTPSFFVMGKPVDDTIDPEDQWYVKEPNAWFVKWLAGKGAIKAIMDSVKPLPSVVFSRFKSGKSKIRKYDWDKFYSKTKD